LILLVSSRAVFVELIGYARGIRGEAGPRPVNDVVVSTRDGNKSLDFVKYILLTESANARTRKR